MRVARRAFLEVVIRDHPDWEQRELANFIGCSQGTIHQDLVSIRRASAQASPATKPLLEPELTLRERLVVQLMNAHPNWTNEEIMEEIAARERKLR
jgi:hypothetical protein